MKVLIANVAVPGGCVKPLSCDRGHLLDRHGSQTLPGGPGGLDQ